MNQNQRNVRLCEVADNQSFYRTEVPKVGKAPRETRPLNARKPVVQDKPRGVVKAQSVKTPRRYGGPAEAEFTTKVHRARRSSSKSRAGSEGQEIGEREPWGSILANNVTRSNEKVSSFNNFDPLRTVHFLVKELQVKLRSPIADEEAVIQMAEDIQEALKRIPPELASLVKNSTSRELKSNSAPDYGNNQDKLYHKGSTTISKSCQTPPTLSQNDTERFQKIMEDNTIRLEASCRQLEVVCTNLQAEKDITEKDLEEARENVEYLSKRIVELERGTEEKVNFKIKQLEKDKASLELELEKATNNNPTIRKLEKLIDELKLQKSLSDEQCAKFQYDNTILKLENEKYSTMLNVREREIKFIQEEMIKLQDQVNVQLNKLNENIITQDSTAKETGDATNRITQIRNTTNDNTGPGGGNNELPYAGDANEIEQPLDRNSEEILQRIADIKTSDTDFNLNAFEEFLKKLNSSSEDSVQKSDV